MEGLGQGLLYSLNYERILGDSLAFRVGASYYSFSGSDRAVLVPMSISVLTLRHGGSSMEVGVGFTPSWESAQDHPDEHHSSFSFASGFLGYRHQPPAGGTQFRIGGGALVSNDPIAPVLPWVYTSLGYAF